MLFTAIDHPSIACRDVRKQAEWYCQNLGMRVLADNGKEPPAMLIGFGTALGAGTTVELMPATDAGPSPATDKRFQQGLRHLAFRVANFEAAYMELKAMKVPFISEPGEALGGGRTVLFRDPEGNQLQIVER